MRAFAWLFLIAACLAAPAAAQEDEVPAPAPEVETSGSEATEPEPPELEASQPEVTDVTIDLGTRLAGSIGFGNTLGPTLSLRLLHGLGADVREGEDRVRAVCAVPIKHCAGGFLIGLDAGSGGGKLSLGLGALADVEEEDFDGTVGVALRATLLRTWGSPLGTESDLTYLGPELDLAIKDVHTTIGVLWRISGQGGSSALFSWSLAVGL